MIMILGKLFTLGIRGEKIGHMPTAVLRDDAIVGTCKERPTLRSSVGEAEEAVQYQQRGTFTSNVKVSSVGQIRCPFKMCLSGQVEMPGLLMICMAYGSCCRVRAA